MDCGTRLGLAVLQLRCNPRALPAHHDPEQPHHSGRHHTQHKEKRSHCGAGEVNPARVSRGQRIAFLALRWRMTELDHITVAARSLAQGLAYLRDALGVDLPYGGAHPRMATHNHLLRLGPALFLELIAIDPTAPPPARPRWFQLDDPT